MVKDNLPEKMQKDENFGGYIGVEEIYNGEMAKSIDVSKFEDVIKSKGKSISFKRAHAKKIKHSLPRPSSAAPTKSIKTSSGKGASLLKSRLDNIIKQIEQKSIPFHTSREEAQDLWGPNEKIVQVHVPKNRGFLQAPKTGKYFISQDYANKLGLSIVGKKINKGIKGGVGGTVAGTALGTALGGPLGGIAGGLTGGAAGDIGERALTNKSKKMNKALPLLPIAAGMAAGALMSKKAKKMEKSEIGGYKPKRYKYRGISVSGTEGNWHSYVGGKDINAPTRNEVYRKIDNLEGGSIPSRRPHRKMEKSGKICTKCGTRYKINKCPVCKVEKAGGKTILGTGIGAGIGSTVGGPIGAGLGGVAGHTLGSALEKPKKSDLGFTRDPKTGRYQKSLLKSQAYLSVERAIHLIKGYEPMSNSAIRKAFGDQVPQQMQDEASRPPEDWWNKCMQETGDEQQCLMMWNKEASQSQAPWIEEKTGGEVEQPEQDGQSQTETDYDNLGKWMGGALQGGTLSSLLGHPIAGQAIQVAGKAIGQKILGKEVSDEEAQKIGMAAFDAIEGVINESDDDSMKKSWPALAARMIPTLARRAGPAITGYQAGQIAANRAMDKRGISQKSVAHVLDKKITDEALRERKPETDFGGESEVSGDGSKANLRSLVERSESQDETGKSAKIDSKKIAHEYKIK